MFIHELKPNKGSRKKNKRVGRGNASGHGTFSGKGCKGQNSRSGGGVRPGFEGGQTPLYRRLPKLKGFKNPFRTEYIPVNVKTLEAFSGETITPEFLYEKGVLSQKGQKIKVLGNGDISVSLTVHAHAFSKVAQEKIEKASGTILKIV
jgi:large subunit ribosomal protein L15